MRRWLTDDWREKNREVNEISWEQICDGMTSSHIFNVFHWLINFMESQYKAMTNSTYRFKKNKQYIYGHIKKR